ncbi:MAG: PCRF domain-containing protein, partial [Patescibacteria group bacterium]
MNIDEYKNNPKTAFLASLYEKLVREENEARQMAEKDPAMRELVLGEIASFVEQKKSLEEQMNGIVAEENKQEEAESLEINEVVLEARAGAGGNEASIFAGELLDMYKRYAEARGWSVKPAEDLSIEIRGKNVYKDLRWETGVHRVQRVPETEKMGRIHTSTASVAILPIRKKSKFIINPVDL